MNLSKMRANFRLKQCKIYGQKPSEALIKSAQRVHKKSKPIVKKNVEKSLKEKFPDVDVLSVDKKTYKIKDLEDLKLKIFISKA